jgi:UDP-N-acetylmuramate--alanine ligase
VVGGSLGAGIFADIVPDAISRLDAPLRRRLTVTQQCRAEQQTALRARYADMDVSADIRPFFDDMPVILANSHLVISRAGASSVAELAAAGRPALLVPFAGAMDDHQTMNANQLASVGGGHCLAETGPDSRQAGRASFSHAAGPGAPCHYGQGSTQSCRRQRRRRHCRLGHRIGRRGSMSELPLSIGTLHFTGIGGIGMSGIAEILFELGYQVQGSDVSENANVRRLRDKGIPVTCGQKAENIDDASIVVISTAIKPDNPELLAARERFLPIVHRAEMLGELMRLRWSVAVAGTHGKTTTTSLIATLLDSARIDPTVINGGIITGWGSNARLGKGQWMVVEADESDGSFSKLNPTVAVVTNIDPEHLDHHGTYEALEAAFFNFVAAIPFYGFATLCIDHPSVQRLMAGIKDRRIITYGLSANADVRAVNMRHEGPAMLFDVMLSERTAGNTGIISDLRFPMLGEHNVQNCLAAIAVALEMGMTPDEIITALAGFGGVGRRFETKGVSGGVTVIDDYGHHPVEIRAALQAGRMLCGTNKLVAVVQPHRYSRLADLFDDFCACFNDADEVLVADVYAAGEAPIDGIDKNALVTGLRDRGHRGPAPLESREDLAGEILQRTNSGDLVMCLGAGDITSWAAALADEMDKLRGGAS